jgi:hypothetical protein
VDLHLAVIAALFGGYALEALTMAMFAAIPREEN